MKPPASVREKAAGPLEKAAALLRSLSQLGAPPGASLAVLAASTGINKPTARRLLLVLENEGFVAQDPKTRLYRLGFGIHALGIAATRHYDLQAICTPSLKRIAKETGDTAILAVRVAADSVCFAREIGDHHLQAVALPVGASYPLGVGAGAMAMLSALPEAEINEILTRPDNAGHELRRPLSDILARVEEVKAKGYHYHDGRNWPGVRELSMAVLDAAGAPAAAITITTVETRMGAERMPMLLNLLRRETAVIEAQLKAG